MLLRPQGGEKEWHSLYVEIYLLMDLSSWTMTFTSAS